MSSVKPTGTITALKTEKAWAEKDCIEVLTGMSHVMNEMLVIQKEQLALFKELKNGASPKREELHETSGSGHG